MNGTIGVRASSMMGALLVAGLAAVVSVLEAAAVSAATVSSFTISHSKTVVIALVGEIGTGDLERVKSAIEKVPKDHKKLLLLDSPGGSINEGIIIGRYVHRVHVPTAVGLGAGCHSACTLIFLAGRDEQSDAPRRIMVAGARIGFHQGSFKPQGGTYSRAALEDFERATQDGVAKIESYLREIKADPEFLAFSLSTAHSSLKLMTEFEALRLGIYVMNPSTEKLITPDEFAKSTQK